MKLLPRLVLAGAPARSPSLTTWRVLYKCINTMHSEPKERRTPTRKGNLREAILAAAEALFSTGGFNAVSVRDIAQAAGANPGSITYHFKSKDGLLLEI